MEFWKMLKIEFLNLENFLQIAFWFVCLGRQFVFTIYLHAPLAPDAHRHPPLSPLLFGIASPCAYDSFLSGDSPPLPSGN